MIRTVEKSNQGKDDLEPGLGLSTAINSKHKFSKGLFFRLSFVHFLLLFGISILGYFFYDDGLSDTYNYAYQALNRHLAKFIASDLEELPSGGIWDIQQLMFRWTSENPNISIFILDKEGKIIADSEGMQGIMANKIPLDTIEEFLQNGLSKNLPIYGINPLDPKKKLIFSAANLELRSRQVKGYVYVTLQNENFARYIIKGKLAQLYKNNVVAILTFVIASLSVGYLFFHLITTPIKRAVKTLSSFQAGDYSKRLGITGNSDEMQILMETINTMADAIESHVSELKHKDELRRELIASVSHDLRSPAASIFVLAEDTLKDPSLSPASADNCRLVLEKCSSLNRLLSELFELAKLEAKESKPNMVPFPIEELVEEFVSAYSISAAGKGIVVKSSYSSPLPWVIGDSAMLARVFTNLIDNALRYTPSGGSISIELDVKEQIFISISDTGVGIPSEQLDRVFEKFYQVKQHTAAENGLSGLGLAIVKKIIEAHGSEISISSIEGAGTSFKFGLQMAHVHDDLERS